LVVSAGAERPQRQHGDATVPELEETTAPVVRPIDVGADGTQRKYTGVHIALAPQAAGRSLRSELRHGGQQCDERTETRPDASEHRGLLEFELEMDVYCRRLPRQRLRRSGEW